MLLAINPDWWDGTGRRPNFPTTPALHTAFSFSPAAFIGQAMPPRPRPGSTVGVQSVINLMHDIEKTFMS